MRNTIKQHTGSTKQQVRLPCAGPLHEVGTHNSRRSTNHQICEPNLPPHTENSSTRNSLSRPITKSHPQQTALHDKSVQTHSVGAHQVRLEQFRQTTVITWEPTGFSSTNIPKISNRSTSNPSRDPGLAATHSLYDSIQDMVVRPRSDAQVAVRRSLRVSQPNHNCALACDGFSCSVHCTNSTSAESKTRCNHAKAHMHDKLTTTKQTTRENPLTQHHCEPYTQTLSCDVLKTVSGTLSYSMFKFADWRPGQAWTQGNLLATQSTTRNACLGVAHLCLQYSSAAGASRLHRAGLDLGAASTTLRACSPVRPCIVRA
jgi:hypothetical protein